MVAFSIIWIAIWNKYPRQATSILPDNIVNFITTEFSKTEPSLDFVIDTVNLIIHKISVCCNLDRNTRKTELLRRGDDYRIYHAPQLKKHFLIYSVLVNFREKSTQKTHMLQKS